MSLRKSPSVPKILAGLDKVYALVFFRRSRCRWLNLSVTEIDARLGFLQKTFKLKGDEVRNLASDEPNLVVWKGTPHQVC